MELDKQITAAQTEIVAIKAHMLDLKMGFEESEKLLAVRVNELQLLQRMRPATGAERQQTNGG